MLKMFGHFTRASKAELNVGLVSGDAQLARQLGDFVAAREGISLQTLSSSAIAAGKPAPEVAIFAYDLASTSDGALREFDRFMSERPQNIPVVVLCPSVEDALVRWFLRLRVADWIRTPLNPADLIAACGRVIGAARETAQTVKCLTFIGARGGVGTTTLAVHAALLAGDRKGNMAAANCLVDLDLVQGACADYLDLVANWQLDELIADPSRLDSHMLDTMTARHASGLSVISAHRKFCERLDFDAEIITRVLDLANQKYENLIVDLPHHAEAWSDSVMLGSSEVYVVTDFTVPGLKSARRILDDIHGVYGGEVKPRAIVNKYSSSFFKGGLSASEAKAILKDSLAGFVRDESALVRDAIDRGVPTTEIKKRNGLVSDLAKIIGA